MRNHAAIISAIEMILIAALAGAGAQAFFASSVYDIFTRYGAAHNIGFMPYLPLIIWGILTTYGLLNIVFRNGGSGPFIWLATVFCLPSLAGHNTVKWLKIFGADFEFKTSLGFTGMLALGVFIVTGYVVLDYLHAFKESERRMAARQVTPADIESAGNFCSFTLAATVSGALAATAAVALLARNLELLMLDYMRALPWNIVFIGLCCFLLLAFYLYWLGARRRGGE